MRRLPLFFALEAKRGHWHTVTEESRMYVVPNIKATVICAQKRKGQADKTKGASQDANQIKSNGKSS